MEILLLFVEICWIQSAVVQQCFALFQQQRVRLGLEVFNITRSSWTFGLCCNCGVRGWTFKSIIRRTAASPVRWSWWLCGGRFVCARGCRPFAMRNSACFWLLISHCEKVVYFRNATSHRAWDVCFHCPDHACGAPFFVPLLFSRKFFDMTLNQILHQLFSRFWSSAVRVCLQWSLPLQLRPEFSYIDTSDSYHRFPRLFDGGGRWANFQNMRPRGKDFIQSFEVFLWSSLAMNFFR